MKKSYVLALGAMQLFLSGVAIAAPTTGESVIKVDGSSTVFPITEAVAEEFGKARAGTKVTVGISGTGGGFKRFCAGETDISDASRPIKQAEVEQCAKGNVNYVELPIAYDALTVVVNPKNTWVKSLTVTDLKKIWEPEAQGKVMTWNQVRPEWPNKPIRLFGAGVDSGTYDYFTESIVGKEGASRGDFTSSEDDNVIVQGVSGDEGALGFFGLAYYAENKDKVKAVAIDDLKADNGDGPQIPSVESVIAGTYKPLARPLFIYVSKSAAERPEVAAFVDYYLQKGAELSSEVGYVQLTKKSYELAVARFGKRLPGTMYGANHSQVTIGIEELLAKTNS